MLGSSLTDRESERLKGGATCVKKTACFQRGEPEETVLGRYNFCIYLVVTHDTPSSHHRESFYPLARWRPVLRFRR